MSSEHIDAWVTPSSVVVRVFLRSQPATIYRFVGQFAHEPYADDVRGLTPGDLQIAGMTADNTAIVATFPREEWTGFEVAGNAEMMTDD